MRPIQAVRGIQDLPLEQLRGAGVVGFILDLDNTLVPPGSDEVPGETRRFLADLRRLGLLSVIVSNARSERADRMGQALGLPVVSRARKPFGRGYRRSLGLMRLPAAKVVAVGDQLLTDGAGAWRQGIPLYLVDPLSHREAFLPRLARPFDRVLRRLLFGRREV